MSVFYDSRTPADGATVPPGTSVTLSCTMHTTGPGESLVEVRLRRRKNGGSWITTTQNPSGSSTTISAGMSLGPSDICEWDILVKWRDSGGAIWDLQLSIRTVKGLPDTTPPTITGVTPAAGNVAPGGSGVVFAGAATDNYRLDWLKLYVDDALEQTWTSTGLKSYIKRSLGPHTYRFEAADGSGNTASTGNINITVINGLPAVPPGAIAVADQTGAVEVANLGHVAVTWPAFLDGNPEDILTYTLENRPAGGTWTPVATGIDGLSYDWSPDIGLGAAELRVKANDGTGDSGYLIRTGITIVSSQSPTEPVLLTPSGGESWREGETHELSWTPATHPEGLPIVIEAEFSAWGFQRRGAGGTFPNPAVDWFFRPLV